MSSATGPLTYISHLCFGFLMLTATQRILGSRLIAFQMLTCLACSLFLLTCPSILPLQHPVFILPLFTAFPTPIFPLSQLILYKSFNTRKNIEIWIETDSHMPSYTLSWY
ncbi:hypothetical protein EDB82DRAFT_38638 [Fusarium venenatum]|uniref:uncharacterized protein n=1 Tax=Fusarium venenatum TaxID=56646 RepID=UPI001DEA573F|nr:hypothetical protein EDB82DRAFT_38638 [Fusarium venenatum]